MKKMMFMLIMVSLFVGSNALAAGDLAVLGNLSVGTSALNNRVTIEGLNETRTLRVTNELNQSGFIMGADYVAKMTGNATGSLYGMSATLNLQSTAATAQALSAASFTALVGGNVAAGTTSVNSLAGFVYVMNSHYNNKRTYNVTDSYGIYAAVDEGSSTATPVNVTNHYHGYFADAGALTALNVTNLTGLWVEEQTSGTNNYGIVLNGNGGVGDYGAAVVLGSSQNAFLYGKADGVYVYDGTSETKISPHDPDTGEWIYYSKNTKTGVIKRVNMEKLVKAVEELTGETFMIEMPLGE